jgi:hypothetical protein
MTVRRAVRRYNNGNLQVHVKEVSMFNLYMMNDIYPDSPKFLMQITNGVDCFSTNQLWHYYVEQ